jgi:hypothetical protein
MAFPVLIQQNSQIIGSIIYISLIEKFTYEG